MKTIRHSLATDPQRQFWNNPAKFRAFIGGIGSGKTRAGCVEAMRQPKGSTGAIIAPSFPMLRDSTLRTFLDLAQSANVLVSFNQTEMVAKLLGGRTILFRQASEPDKLRGPNLSWIYLDEAALISHQAYLVLLGRLRVNPQRLWLTTSPLGKSNWIYREFGEPRPDRALIRASTRTNRFLPNGFIETLEAAYDSDFAKQEIDGEWLDDAYGQLIPSPWLERASSVNRPAGNPGPRYLGCDPSGGTGRDHSAICVIDRYGILHLESSNTCDIPHTALRIKQLSDQFGVSQANIGYDAGTGGGGDELPRFLIQYGITATRYLGGQSGGDRFANKRSHMGLKLKQLLDPNLPPPLVQVYRDPYGVKPQPVFVPNSRLQPPFCIPSGQAYTRLKEEISALKFIDRQSKFSLETKEAMKSRLGRSPDVLDSLFIALSKLPEDQYQRI